jgi:hypothetical protein
MTPPVPDCRRAAWREQPTGQPPAPVVVPVESSIPVGVTIREYRRSRARKEAT